MILFFWKIVNFYKNILFIDILPYKPQWIKEYNFVELKEKAAKIDKAYKDFFKYAIL